jgi:hypothetical protein
LHFKNIVGSVYEFWWNFVWGHKMVDCKCLPLYLREELIFKNTSYFTILIYEINTMKCSVFRKSLQMPKADLMITLAV